MAFDIDSKIQELRGRLEKAKADEIYQQMPKWCQFLQEIYYTSQIEKLEAIKNRRFRVTINLEVHCETFRTKEFPVIGFDLTDDTTVKNALLDFSR